MYACMYVQRERARARERDFTHTHTHTHAQTVEEFKSTRKRKGLERKGLELKLAGDASLSFDPFVPDSHKKMFSPTMGRWQRM